MRVQDPEETKTRLRPAQFRSCRICGLSEPDRPTGPSKADRMFRYGPRHWAHADCAIDLHGAGFPARLSVADVEIFPEDVLIAAGMPDALAKEKLRRSEWMARSIGQNLKNRKERPET